MTVTLSNLPQSPPLRKPPPSTAVWSDDRVSSGEGDAGTPHMTQTHQQGPELIINFVVQLNIEPRISSSFRFVTVCVKSSISASLINVCSSIVPPSLVYVCNKK